MHTRFDHRVALTLGAHTYGMIEMIDDGVGRILKALEQKGEAENTIVMFTSDHGELLGTHP